MLCVRFCNLWILWILRIRRIHIKKHKMDGCVVWLIEAGKVKGTLLFAKAKSSKNFLDSA